MILSKLPPELLRKGRFDELFFVDLPDHSSRKKLFEIHLGNVNDAGPIFVGFSGGQNGRIHWRRYQTSDCQWSLHEF